MKLSGKLQRDANVDPGFSLEIYASEAKALEDTIDAVKAALWEYHNALDRRQHGGLAAAEWVRKTETAIGTTWNQDATLPATEPATAADAGGSSGGNVCEDCGREKPTEVEWFENDELFCKSCHSRVPTQNTEDR